MMRFFEVRPWTLTNEYLSKMVSPTTSTRRSGEPGHGVGQVLRGNACGQLSAEFSHLGVGRFEMAVEQAGGTEDHLTEVAHLPPVLLHGGDVVADVAGDVIGGVGILRALAINLRLDRLDRFHRGRVRDEHDIIDTRKGGKGAGAEGVVEIRTSRTLVDVFFVGHRDHEQIAELLGVLQVDDVTGVHQIECAVALHKALALGAQFVEERRRFGEEDYFGRRHFLTTAGAQRRRPEANCTNLTDGERMQRPAEPAGPTG